MATFPKYERLVMLERCAEQPTSAKDIAGNKDQLPSVAYHIRELRKDGLIRRSGERRRRGAIQTFYVATPKGEEVLMQIGLDGASS